MSNPEKHCIVCGAAITGRRRQYCEVCDPTSPHNGYAGQREYKYSAAMYIRNARHRLERRYSQELVEKKYYLPQVDTDFGSVPFRFTAYTAGIILVKRREDDPGYLRVTLPDGREAHTTSLDEANSLLNKLTRAWLLKRLERAEDLCKKLKDRLDLVEVRNA